MQLNSDNVNEFLGKSIEEIDVEIAKDIVKKMIKVLFQEISPYIQSDIKRAIAVSMDVDGEVEKLLELKKRLLEVVKFDGVVDDVFISSSFYAIFDLLATYLSGILTLDSKAIRQPKPKKYQ